MSKARSLSTFAVLALASAAYGQISLPFNIKIQQGTVVTNATDGTPIAFQADAIGKPTSVGISITHTGVPPANQPPTASPVGVVTITAIDLSGSTDFSYSGNPDPSQTFRPNDNFTLNLQYKPTTSLRVTGILKISYSEQLPTPANGVQPKAITGSFSFPISGVAPEFTFSYQPPPNGNTTPLNPGDTILFPITNVNDTPAATVVLTNKGSGPGVVNAITVAGAVFAPGSLPPAQTSVDTLKTLVFTVRYSPLQIETSRGSVRIDFIDHSVTFNLLGTSQGPLFTYSVLQESGATSVLAGDTIALPDAPLTNTPSSVVVRVQNSGNFDGKIASIDVAGLGFTLSEVPFVPLTLTAGSAVTFTVNFNPTQPGRVNGRLRVGLDTFTVTGNGLGQTLVYSYTAGSVTSTVVNNNSVIFPPIGVGQSSSVTFQISNAGTAPGSVNSISVSQPQAPGSPPPPVTAASIFTVTKVPSLPANIAAGDVLTFTVTFSPQAVGSSTGVLRIDNLVFPVSGVANPPAAMPNYTYTGASGAQDPLQQAGVGLTLASTYPLNLNGVLTLAFNSDVFANDPAVQFATGGRTVNFTIPAGTTQAVFPNNSTTLRLQTGTVAGTITMTPSFVTDGGINLTPTVPPALNLTVAQSAPRLLTVQVASKTATAITLLVTGYATSRSVTQVDLQFAQVAGENLGSPKLSLNVDASFTAWFQSTASQQFGSQFTMTLPFTLQGDLVNTTTFTSVTDAIQSVAVTLTNRQGVSAPQIVSLK